MARSNIIEKTEAEIIAESPTKVFRPAFASTPAIPATYDGKYVVLAAIAVDIEPTEAQMDAFETAVGNINNVHKCFIMLGPARIPLDRVPDGYDLKIGVEGSFRIEPTPVE